MSKGTQIAGGATVIALLLGWFAATNLESGASFTYYQDLASFQAAADEQRGQPSRIHGYVSIGSIERDVPAKQVRFAIQEDPPHAGGDPGDPLSVTYTSLETPDLFKDGAEVVVEGHLTSESSEVFEADKLMAKCPSKFAAQADEAASL